MWTREKTLEYHRLWREKNREKMNSYARKSYHKRKALGLIPKEKRRGRKDKRTRAKNNARRYQLTVEQYSNFIFQGCMICGKNEGRMVIDHCHETNIIRGSLCGNCNTGLGMFKDDPLLLLSAAIYRSDGLVHKSDKTVLNH